MPPFFTFHLLINREDVWFFKIELIQTYKYIKVKAKQKLIKLKNTERHNHCREIILTYINFLETSTQPGRTSPSPLTFNDLHSADWLFLTKRTAWFKWSTLYHIAFHISLLEWSNTKIGRICIYGKWVQLFCTYSWSNIHPVLSVRVENKKPELIHEGQHDVRLAINSPNHRRNAGNIQHPRKEYFPFIIKLSYHSTSSYCGPKNKLLPKAIM